MAGFSVLRDRFLPVLLHVVLKKVLAGAFWWIICGIAVVLLLLVLSLVELINSNAVGPVFAALVSFFLGFFLFAVFDFLRSLIQFFRSTRTRRRMPVSTTGPTGVPSWRRATGAPSGCGRRTTGPSRSSSG